MSIHTGSRGTWARLWVSRLVLSWSACACTVAAADGVRYTAKFASDYGMNELVALNNRGQVLGTSKERHILFFDGVVTVDLGTFGYEAAYPQLLDDSGRLTVSLERQNGSVTDHYLYSNGLFTRLPKYYQDDGVPRGINSRGELVWFRVSFEKGGTVGEIYRDGVITDLGYLDTPEVYPWAINRSDQVVGTAFVNGGTMIHAFVWQEGKMRDLGFTLDTESGAKAINEAGSIIGWSDNPTTYRRLFLYSAGRRVDLGRIGNFSEDLYDSATDATAMNDYGVVVGGSAGRPFIWRGGKVENLREMVDTTDERLKYLSDVTHINNLGQILANGRLVLTPIAPTGEPAHLVNVSTRASAGTGDDTCITGFVLAGGERSILVRTVGPGLADQEVHGFAPNPSLKLFDRGVVTAENDDWGTGQNAAEIAAAMKTVGAFALGQGSYDAAVLAHASEGIHSVHAADPSGHAGVVLSEIYDAGTGGSGRLVNCSARVHVGAGDAIGILGFVVAGEGPVTVLLRAIGPGLRAQGVSNVLTDPVLRLHSTKQDLMGNDNWGSADNQPVLAQSMRTCGAFPLEDGSKDAALVVELNAGAYTVTVEGADGGQGAALIEVYVVR